MSETPEPFHERFKRLIADQKPARIELESGLSRDQIRRLSNGDTQSIDLIAGLKLARFLGISPWELVGESPPPVLTPPADSVGENEVDSTVEVPTIASLARDLAALNKRLEPVFSLLPALQRAQPAQGVAQRPRGKQLPKR